MKSRKFKILKELLFFKIKKKIKTFQNTLFLRKQEKYSKFNPLYKYSQTHNTKTICLMPKKTYQFQISLASQQMLQFRQKLA